MLYGMSIGTVRHDNYYGLHLMKEEYRLLLSDL